MSLQGSFETIALRDVMALLASSNKSGELRVVGGHVEGRLWFDAGRLVASKVGKTHDHVDAMFELLRLTEGNFVFKDGVEAPAHEDATPVEPVVHEAEERLNEWHDIEAVVPSLEHRVRLIPDLPTPEVTLSAQEWRLVMAVALAATVHGALEEVGLSQFEGCRGIRRLVDAGLVIVEPPRVRPSAADPARAARRAASANGASLIAETPSAPRVARRPAPPASTPELEYAAAAPAAAEGSLASLAALALSGGSVRPAAPVGEMTSPFEAALRAFPSEYDDEAELGLVHQFPVIEDEEVDDAALPYAVGSAGDPAPASFVLPERNEAEALRGRRARRQAASLQGEPMTAVTAAPVAPVAPVARTVRPVVAEGASLAVHPDGAAGAAGGAGNAGGSGAAGHDAGRADDQDRDPESINRGLLLKFLSSVRS
ncbi:MAG: resuscitation-promoting factor RpfA [Acidimicrobiaceae bacterium]|nr:resuscitation-promoting factor RpfA [Acidimicrobiaceae bacterium]